MSRIGNAPVVIPSGVTVDYSNENMVVVTGPLGSLRRWIDPCISLTKTTVDNKNVIVFSRNSEDKEVRAKHGLYRALVSGMVEGVTKGFTKNLIVNGVGFKVSVNGNKLVLNIGFSHSCEVVIPKDIKITCPSVTEIKVEGFDKEKVGQIAADIKALRPVEPYHNYGIYYANERLIKKEIKKAAKKK